MCWDLWFYIRPFKDLILWLAFYSDPRRSFVIRDICIHLHMQTLVGIMWKEMLQSAGSHLWKLVAGKPDRAPDLWSSTPDRITPSSSEVQLLLINSPIWLLNNPHLVSLQPEPGNPLGSGPLTGFSIFPFTPPEPKRAWHYKDKITDKLCSVAWEQRQGFNPCPSIRILQISLQGLCSSFFKIEYFL